VKGYAPRLSRSLYIYPTPLHVVLPAMPGRARNGALPRSYCIRISKAAYGFPRSHLVGNSLNRGNGTAPALGSVPTRRRSGGEKAFEEGGSESPTSTGTRLSAVSQVNTREEHERAQHFGKTEALTEDDDA
jgi:hypothetical protein